jgi:hypothetical protein
MASFTRANAVFLTIDSATVSGVAISVPEADARGRVTGYCEVMLGEARTQKHRAAFVADALEQAKDCGVPLVVVGEEWTHHGLSAAAYASLCENWGKWLAAIETANAKCHIVRVKPNTWRAAVFGKHKPSTRDGLKTFAIRYVHQTLDQPLNLSDNIAEALCLRVWGERAAEVHALLAPKAAKTKKKKAPLKGV